MRVWVQLPSWVHRSRPVRDFMFITYILYSRTFDRYYVGHCEDMVARLSRHNGRQVNSTKAYVPWELVYTESFSSRAEAAAREKEIKRMKSRQYIERLIARLK